MVLLGTGSDVQSGSGDAGMTPEIQTHTRISYCYFGSLRVGMRQGVVGQGGDSVYYLHADHLGSVSETTGATGDASRRSGTIRMGECGGGVRHQLQLHRATP